jgi:hypothetical protein
MKWVTWERVGVDRMGSAWLIHKHIDPKAEFLFIAADQTAPKGAEPFDIPGVRMSHHRGQCTFHTLLKYYKLKDPVLKRMARIIDETDTVQDVSVEAAAAGLDLICRGIRLTSRDDHTALKRGAMVYEALYAQLKSETLKAPTPARWRAAQTRRELML